MCVCVCVLCAVCKLVYVALLVAAVICGQEIERDRQRDMEIDGGDKYAEAYMMERGERDI